MTVVRAFVAVALAAVVAPSVAGAAVGRTPLQPGLVEPRRAGAIQQKEESALDISGIWVFEVTSAAGTGTPTITFTQKGETLTGQYLRPARRSADSRNAQGSRFDVQLRRVCAGHETARRLHGQGHQGCAQGNGRAWGNSARAPSPPIENRPESAGLACPMAQP